MRLRTAAAGLAAVIAASFALPAASASAAAVSDQCPRDGRSAAADTRILGGCVFGVCGTVYNRTSETVSVTMNWGDIQNNICRLNGHANTEGWGDVDGIYVPTQRKMDVFITAPFGNRWVAWGPGWHKISTDEYAHIDRIYKP
ncbi:hypothetical protein [Kitasatospora sp. NPDC001547]|uniref:hypothetical protein n=1 Tax=Kitasatospora sp. NPDC001547 TaxID=3364015 RepID=UPI0036B0B4EE